MVIVAPCPFADDFEITAPLERALGPHVVRVTDDPQRDADMLADAEVLVTGFDRQQREPIDYVRAMPRLRWIHSLIAGLGSIATPEVADRGVLVTNGAGVFAVAIAEYAFASLVMLARGLPELMLASADGVWAAPQPLGRELCGGRAAVVGFGGIGRRVAELLAGAGMHVTAVTRTPAAHTRGAAEAVVGPAELREVLAGADAVVLCASLNPTTDGLLGERELGACRPGALLVNVARGRLVDERALAAALTGGPLAAAMIDVAETEPLPPDSPLWRLPNLWITPHLAGGTHEGKARAIERFIGNLERFVAGEAERMESVVDLRREIDGRQT
jgi:phosphoglycerate dehydrogenase-like enzyme